VLSRTLVLLVVVGGACWWLWQIVCGTTRDRE
jgi:hypothetical protein